MRIYVESKQLGIDWTYLTSTFRRDEWLLPHLNNIVKNARDTLVKEGHIRTWSLFSSIRVEKEADGYSVVAGDDQPEERPSSIYASYIEGGTQNHPAYPYIEPAYQQELPKIIASANTFKLR